MTSNQWHCRDNRECLPVSKTTPSDAKIHENQNICRLLCGKFGSLWPTPTEKCQLGSSVIAISSELIRFEYPSFSLQMVDYFDQMTFLFLNSLSEECGSECSSRPVNEMFIRIQIESKSLKLYAATDESYRLNISTTTNRVMVQIQAETVYGARHALETLTQLTVKRMNNDLMRNELVVITEADIADKPIYQHRGLLVDTARHFIPVSTILKIFNGMSACKMNVFHWHISDSQSFPMESKRLPQMTEYGAFAEDKIYRQIDIESVIKYGKYRGIRVIIEIDSPAHAGHGFTWGKDYGVGDLAVCVDDQPWRKKCIQPNCGQLNPANENVYSVLKDIYEDIRDMKEKDEFFHMGGDEVFIPCWNSTKEIVDYMMTKNYKQDSEGFTKLWAEFHAKALNVWDKITGFRNDSIVLWSSDLTSPENIEKYLPKDRYIIQTWLPNTADIPKQLLDKGYRLIMSTKNAWYLDHGFWGTTKYYSWKTAYLNRLPLNSLVLGGEACMWSEYVDEHSIEVKIWPRTAAIAERLWSDPSNVDMRSVESRFNRQRERLISKGIQPDATIPEYCSLFEGDCA